MIDLSNIKNYCIPPPQNGTVFGTAAEFDALPETHKAQILFLDTTARKFLYEFIDHACLLSDGGGHLFRITIIKPLKSLNMQLICRKIFLC